jgi:hypothetical protein
MGVAMLLVSTAGLFSSGASASAATLRPETVRAWDNYVELTERRIASELDSKEGFLVQDFIGGEDAEACRTSVQAGEICILKMETLNEVGRPPRIPSGMVHHWLGSVFVPGIELSDLVSWVQNYPEHENYFDEVEDSELLSRKGDVFEILLRLKRKKIVTVHYNTEHHVEYRYHGPNRVSSTSYTTKISQLENVGRPSEREKPEGRDNGFLWRLNSYWRFQQVDGGVIVECESMSLSRGIPRAVKWLVGRYVNSVPRESMASTLESMREGATLGSSHLKAAVSQATND